MTSIRKGIGMCIHAVHICGNEIVGKMQPLFGRGSNCVWGKGNSSKDQWAAKNGSQMAFCWSQ